MMLRLATAPRLISHIVRRVATRRLGSKTSGGLSVRTRRTLGRRAGWRGSRGGRSGEFRAEYCSRADAPASGGGMSRAAKAMLALGGGMGVALWFAHDTLQRRGVELDIWGMLFPDTTPEEKIKIEEPELIPPNDYVHPYTQWSWPRRYWFVFRRASFLLSIWVPRAFDIFWGWCRGRFYDPDWIDWILDRVVKTLERSGPGFQKFGQWMAQRPDLLPNVVCRALAKLQDNAPQHSYEETERVIRESFGRDLGDIFETFDREPIASGTVAQVYRATLRREFALQDGTREVAVKVRHPNVLDASFVDLALLFSLTQATKSLGISIALPFKKEEFYLTIQKQVDFKWEAYNLLKFAQNFRREATGRTHSSPRDGRAGAGLDPAEKIEFCFPKVHTDLLSDNVLVESWAPGENLAQMLARKQLRAKVWDDHLSDAFKQTEPDANPMSEEEVQLRQRLAFKVMDIATKMFLRDNFIHGDLHAGNIMYSEAHNLITVIDAGLATNLEDGSMNPFGDFLRAMCTGDGDVIVEKLIEFNVNPHFSGKTIPQFKRDVNSILDKYMGANREKAEDGLVMGYIMGEILNTLGPHAIMLRGDVSASLMTISISEGLILSLDPTFDLVKSTLPYFIRYSGWDSLTQIQTADYVTTSTKTKANLKGGIATA